MLTRRDFLKTSSLLALAPTVPGFLARTAHAALPERDGRVLVVLQLDGGNDGINTVVPYADDGYARHRKALRLEKKNVLKINDHVGLHPAMSGAAKLLQTGRLAIVQGVGYPNPNRSHFESMAIWHTARLDPEERTGLGWLGRALDEGKATSGPGGLLIGTGQPPVALRGRRSVASALGSLDDLAVALPMKPKQPMADGGDDLAAFLQRSTLDAYATADQLKSVSHSKPVGPGYPETGLGRKLRLVSQLLKTGVGTRIFYATQGSYDTHAVQLPTHADLLGELSGAMRAFLDDLAAARLADRVAVLCFSEFGRRVAENGSQGTDHGTAGPVFLAGAGVQAGLVGPTPSLMDLEAGDLKTSLDFRRVYATVLEEWLGLPAKTALAGTFEPLRLFRA